ncbi:LacI family DNA-binding transcriptional regulator [Microbacterium sp. B2969]|uniref:LacI family DNA-binding transcriptional regulator n=1 Tax=Microbacterium alkaliflavum TaxID=3248839 RepID=A0ABW7QHY6_9MICO
MSSEDIAKAAQVSRATVSYVLNDKPGRRISEATRERVLRAARSLGYVPDPAAIALRSGRSRIVLLQEYSRVPPEGRDVLAMGSTGGLLRDAVAREVQSWGMVLVSCGVDFPLVTALKYLTPGLVLAPGGLSADDRAAVEQAGIPWSGCMPDGRGLLSMLTDALALQQVAHLKEQGHDRIGYVSSNLDELSDMARQRRAAIFDACSNLGVECAETFDIDRADERAISDCVSMLPAWREAGITAVAAFNDICAAVVLRAAYELGWDVPDTLAVVGVDDEPLAALLDPPLTTVRLQMADFGAHLAARGRAELDKEPLPAFPTDLTPLIRRRST